MDDVRQQIKDRINRLRADVTTLTAQNIKTIIGLYDKTFFSGQIAEKFKTDKVPPDGQHCRSRNNPCHNTVVCH